MNNDIKDILDNIPLAVNNCIWFQQDRAPFHNSQINMKYLTQRFENKLIATNGPIRCPVQSPGIFSYGVSSTTKYTGGMNEHVEQLRAEV
nr:unnamed protein product [Callosobruchus chinensis]